MQEDILQTKPSTPCSDEDIHKIMDINKVFPKPPEVEQELQRAKQEEQERVEKEELARVRALAPALLPPTVSQLMAAQIGKCLFSSKQP